ncbi:AP-5 complex subunit zeta-1 [Branchiostoma belcheri]|nr:AP-5 complex subunit zeta-1 [Branchiostoma belcheri]
MGEPIVPTTNKKIVVEEGEVLEKVTIETGRKVPLKDIQANLLKKQVQQGLIRPVEECDKMDLRTVTDQLIAINENDESLTLKEKQEKLAKLRSTRFCDLGFCMRRPVKSMEDRRLLVESMPAGRKGGIAPFNSLKKQDLIRNLDATNIDFDLECNKPGLEKQLREHLAGVSNVPALLYGDQHRTVDELNLGQYEIAPCEALHNSKEHIKNILEELPNHLCDKDKAAMKEVAAMFQGKEMQRGVDYRKHLLTVTVKMATQDGNPKAIALLESLCNITHILYLGEQDRTNQQILRLANQTYLHGILVREVIGTETKSITKRKLYGQYWHSLTTHAPMLYRIVNLKSVNAENQERMFDSLKGILGQTSSRRPSEVVGMGVLRLQAEQRGNADNVSQDESQVSSLGRNLRVILPPQNTLIPWRYLTKPSLRGHYQPHLERIADFLVQGEGVWWKRTEDGILFLDAPGSNHIPEPPVHHFRSTTYKREQEYLEERWKVCIRRQVAGELMLPHVKHNQPGVVRCCHVSGLTGRRCHWSDSLNPHLYPACVLFTISLASSPGTTTAIGTFTTRAVVSFRLNMRFIPARKLDVCWHEHRQTLPYIHRVVFRAGMLRGRSYRRVHVLQLAPPDNAIVATRALIEFVSMPTEAWEPDSSNDWPQVRNTAFWQEAAEYVREQAGTSFTRSVALRDGTLALCMSSSFDTWSRQEMPSIVLRHLRWNVKSICKVLETDTTVSQCSYVICNIEERGVSFHKFPKDHDRLHRWLVSMRNNLVNKLTPEKIKELVHKKSFHWRVCSDHFEPGCFTRSSVLKRQLCPDHTTYLELMKDAVPTLFSGPGENDRNQGRPP